jgi:hypothetical protein
MKTEQNAFPTSDQSDTQPPPNRLSASVRWLLSFSFFLALFAVLITLISYGFISLSGVEQKQAAAAARQPTTQAPSPEPSVLPSGTAGHVAGNQAQPAAQPAAHR